MVVDLAQKMDVLWSFIKSHLKAKTIIFLSTCKQVCPVWVWVWVRCSCGDEIALYQAGARGGRSKWLNERQGATTRGRLLAT